MLMNAMESPRRLLQRAFLIFEIGGTGSKAGNALELLLGQHNPRVFFERLHLDLDRNEHSTAAASVDLSLKPEQVRTLVKNASSFGPFAPEAVKALEENLDPNTIESGAKTVRGVCQLALAYHEEALRKALRRCIDAIKKQGRVQRIAPLVVCSNGGGTGSAGSVVIPRLLASRRFRASILSGFSPDLLEPAVVIAASPFAFANSYASNDQALKILANRYAWALEIDDCILKNHIQYCATIGYSNSAGTLLDTEQQMTRVLAASAFRLITRFDFIRARLVDGVPNPSQSRYCGDTAEELDAELSRLRSTYFGEE